MPNPFTQAQQALHDYLAAHWDALPDSSRGKVKVNNRFGRSAAKAALAPNDVPAVDVRPVEGRGLQFAATSSTGVFARAYELGIETDETLRDNVPESLDETEWELIRVAARAANEKLGLPSLVYKVELESSRHTPADTEQNRGRRRWSGVVTLVVYLQVPRADILPS